MFGLLKRKKPYEQEAALVFERAHEQSRRTEFYTDLLVEDSTEGRFGVLALHMFMVMHVLKDIKGGPELSQSLFDFAFADIDRGYREIGVGDMGIPKRMKKLMLSFNGAMHAYEAGLESEDGLKPALRRNIYTAYIGEEKALEKPLNVLAAYVYENIAHLQSQKEEAMIKGNVQFKEIKGFIKT